MSTGSNPLLCLTQMIPSSQQPDVTPQQPEQQQPQQTEEQPWIQVERKKNKTSIRPVS